MHVKMIDAVKSQLRDIILFHIIWVLGLCNILSTDTKLLKALIYQVVDF